MQDGDHKSEHDEAASVEEVLGDLDELAAHHDQVCIGDVLDDFGERSFGPFILIPALIEESPVGAIPGVPTFLAVVIALTAAQLFAGRDHVWMPQIIQKRAISGKKLHKAVGKLRGIAHWLDQHSHGRLENLVEGWWLKGAALAVIALCCTIPPLEFLPFASAAPMFAIAIFGLALTVRDGLFMAIAMAVALAAVAIGAYLLLTSGAG